MTTFAVTDQSQVIDAINYALSNLGQSGSGSVAGNVLTANLTTGVITTSTSSNYISYLYRYINIAYATAGDGSSGFSRAAFSGATYFGVQNSNAATPATIDNPASYQWTAITGGLGSNFVYYTTPGGQQIQYFIGSAPPSSSYVVTVDYQAIDLTFVTATTTLPIVTLSAYYDSTGMANVVPATPTGGTYNFGNLQFTAPSGWSNSVPGNSTSFYTSQNTFKSTGTGNVIVGPSVAWTTPVLTGQVGNNGSNGVSTYTYPIYYNANTTPATPTGGYWDFGTSIGTPPSGWSNVATASGQTIYISTTTVSSNVANANVSIGNNWAAPVAYSGAGQTGQRGFIPMAYVLTPATPLGNLANVTFQANLSSWFNASTSGTPPGSNTAPVGTGYPPVGGDTAAFTFASNSAQVKVYTFNSGNLLWSNADGQVINGNVFVTGSVNANKLNANDVYALNIVGGNGVVGNNSSGGFWMQASSGNARMAGSVSIGNLLTVGSNAVIGGNLTIGNNASIGGNLTVAGLITGSGAGAVLNANTVTTTTVVPGAITLTDYYQTSYNIMMIDNPVANTVYYGGTMIANSCSSSGTTVTTTGFLPQWLDDQYYLVGSPISVIAGTGAFAGGTTISSVTSDTQLVVSATPTTPLLGATIRSVGPMDLYYRQMPGLYITTSAANQVAQLNLNGVVEVDATSLTLAGGYYGQISLYVYVIRYPYVAGNTIDTSTGSVVYVQTYSLPAVYIAGIPYVQTQNYTFAGIVDEVPTAGTWVYTVAFVILPFDGTWSFKRLRATALAGSGTVLKNQ